MKRFAVVIRLRPEKEAEYRAPHAAAWPGVLAAPKPSTTPTSMEAP